MKLLTVLMLGAVLLTIPTALLVEYLSKSMRLQALAKIEAIIRVGPDPKLDVSPELLKESLECFGQSQSGDTILLMHGTGQTASRNWDYTLRPPLQASGYHVCQVTIPEYLFLPTSYSAQYIVYAVRDLAGKSPTSKVTIISWSSGGLVTQWALTFFPSLRGKTRQHISLAPSYHGIWFLQLQQDLLKKGTSGDLQTTPRSKAILARLQAGGGQALVPTLNLASTFDLLVQPSFDAPFGLWNATWKLEGALAHNLDLYRLCGYGSQILSHDTLLWSSISHHFIFAALDSASRYILDNSTDTNNRLTTLQNIGSKERELLQQNECRQLYATGVDSAWKVHHESIMTSLFELLPLWSIRGGSEAPLPDYAV